MDEFHNCNVYNKENFFCILKYYLFPKSLNLSYVETLAIIIYLDVYLHLDLLTCNDLFIIPLNKSNNCQSIVSRFSFFSDKYKIYINGRNRLSRSSTFNNAFCMKIYNLTYTTIINVSHGENRIKIMW